MLCRVWNKGIATKYVDIVFFLHEYMPIRRLFFYNKLHLKCYFWMVSTFYELIWYAFEEKLLHNYEVISYDDSDLLFKPASQALHFNGFFSSWTDSICSFKLTFWTNHKHCILMASFLHELIQYVHSNLLLGQNFCCKCYTWMASFSHELFQYAHSKIYKWLCVDLE